ncbi:transposase [Mycobacterium heckeshornense]|nr:transposase [Mycobacterium heckeshornense]
MVTKTATVSLHANTYQVDAALVGRKVGLVFSPFDLETVEVRYRDKSFGKALPHSISRHTHPKAKPETPELEPPAATGIDYLALTAAAHHEQLRRDERIGYHALYGQDGEIAGQLSLDDLAPSGDADHDGEVSA